MFDPITKTMSELKKLQTARRTLEDVYAADQAKIAELKGTLADVELAALLDGGDSGKVRAEIYACQVRMEGLEAARPKLLAKIRECLRALGRERAKVKFSEADKLAGKLATHAAEVDRARVALEELAGCPFAQAMHPELPAGKVYAMTELPYCGPSIAQRMAAEVAGLRTAAAQIERTALDASRGGRVEGSTLAELLAVCDDVERIAPTRSAVQTWLESATAAAEARWREHLTNYSGAQETKPVGALVIAMVWDGDGQLDVAKSRADIRGQVPDNRRAAVEAGKRLAEADGVLRASAA